MIPLICMVYIAAVAVIWLFLAGCSKVNEKYDRDQDRDR